jgi:hypothetical protein
MKRGRRDTQCLSHRDSLIGADVEQPWEPDRDWGLSHPPVSPKANPFTIFNSVSSSQLKEMFDFVYTTPELGASLASGSKDVISVKVLGLKKLKPKRVLFCRVKKPPNPFRHESNI